MPVTVLAVESLLRSHNATITRITFRDGVELRGVVDNREFVSAAPDLETAVEVFLAQVDAWKRHVAEMVGPMFAEGPYR